MGQRRRPETESTGQEGVKKARPLPPAYPGPQDLGAGGELLSSEWLQGEAVGGSGENRSGGSSSMHSPSPGWPPSCRSDPLDPGVLILTTSTLRRDAGDTPGLWGVPEADPVRTRVHTEKGGGEGAGGGSPDPQESGEGASWREQGCWGSTVSPFQPTGESSLMRLLKLLG